MTGASDSMRPHPSQAARRNQKWGNKLSICVATRRPRVPLLPSEMSESAQCQSPGNMSISTLRKLRESSKQRSSLYVKGYSKQCFHPRRKLDCRTCVVSNDPTACVAHCLLHSLPVSHWCVFGSRPWCVLTALTPSRHLKASRSRARSHSVNLQW